MQHVYNHSNTTGNGAQNGWFLYLSF